MRHSLCQHVILCSSGIDKISGDVEIAREYHVLAHLRQVPYSCL